MGEERLNCLKRRCSSAFWVGAAQNCAAITVNSEQQPKGHSTFSWSVVAAAAWSYRLSQYSCWVWFFWDWDWCFTKGCLWLPETSIAPRDKSLGRQHLKSENLSYNTSLAFIWGFCIRFVVGELRLLLPPAVWEMPALVRGNGVRDWEY